MEGVLLLSWLYKRGIGGTERYEVACRTLYHRQVTAIGVEVLEVGSLLCLSPLSGVHLLNNTGPHETYKQGSSG